MGGCYLLDGTFCFDRRRGWQSFNRAVAMHLGFLYARGWHPGGGFAVVIESRRLEISKQ